MRRGRGWLFVALAALALAILAARAAGQIYVDYQWYASLGAAALWRTKAENVALLKVGSLVVGGAFIFANLYAVRRSVASVVLPRRVGDLEIAEELSDRALLGAVALASLALAAALTLPNDTWTSLAAVRFGTPFGESDPRFQADLGFWVYWLPLEQALYARTLVTVAVVIAAVAFVYALTPSLRLERGTLRVSPYARRHLSVLSGVVLLVLGWSYRLSAFSSLIDGSGPAGLVSWVDHKVHVPASLAMAVVSLLAGALVAFTGWAGQTRLAFASATTVLALSLLLRQAAPAIAERGTGGASVEGRDSNYVAMRGAYTRRAYGADRVGAADASLAYATPAAAAAGVPLWDPEVFARAVERTRREGTVTGGVGLVGSAAAPVLQVAERPDVTADGASPRPWRVVRAAGAATGPRGDVVGPSGLPLADDSADAVLPALVFENARGYALLTDSAPHVVAVDASGSWARLALALSQQNVRLLARPARPTRMLLRRDLRDRLRRLAPFLTQGRAVAPAVAGDTLYWLVHLYARSPTYPVSEPTSFGGRGTHYLHHAATAVANAYSGAVSIIPAADLDPVARTWVDAIPSSFATWADLPPELRASVPPAAESGLAQAHAFAAFGARGDEPPRSRAVRVSPGDSASAAGTVPVVALAPNGGTPALSVPVADGAGRLAGLVLVLGGSAARTAWYPIASAPADPSIEMMVDRLRRGTDPAGAGRDDAVTVGSERVVPVAGGAGYILPRYVQRGDAAPLLAGAVTSFAGEVRQGRTAVEAAGPIVADVAQSTEAPPADNEDAVRRARQHYDAARAALRAGDWAAFGRAYDALGAALRPRQR